MVTWILILTLVDYHAGAIHSVPGFATKAACVAAGDAWLTQPRMGGEIARRAVCVPSS